MFLGSVTPAQPDPIIKNRPVGEIIRTAEGEWGVATATFDRFFSYRYRLSRVWDTERPRAVWVMLNPSTATEVEIDPSVRRILTFSRDWGCGSAEVVNLFALRATNPDDLYVHGDPVGSANDDALSAAAVSAEKLIAAWGVHGAFLNRNIEAAKILTKTAGRLEVLGLTKEGHPKHPLYVRKSTSPSAWFHHDSNVWSRGQAAMERQT